MWRRTVPYTTPMPPGCNVLDSGKSIRDIGALGHYNITDNVTFKAQISIRTATNNAPINGYGLKRTPPSACISVASPSRPRAPTIHSVSM